LLKVTQPVRSATKFELRQPGFRALTFSDHTMVSEITKNDTYFKSAFMGGGFRIHCKGKDYEDCLF
jgi:hypothetical protein